MSQVLRRFNASMERIEDERKIGRILLESQAAESPTTVTRATLPGDTRRLRGIPCIARGVAGVSPGTHPSDRLR
jgi:hypothetical protein